MADIRSPGVYLEKVEGRVPGLALTETGQPAFLGFATRGPLHEPVRITSLNDFANLYGPPVEGGYLAEAVRGFFENSGEVCYVVRIAHTFQRGRSEIATRAALEVLDLEGQPTLRVEARDEGEWGNAIRVEVKIPPPVQTFITRDLLVGDTRMQVRSARGIQPGSICRVHDGKSDRFLTITRVDGKTLAWHEPLDIGFKSNAPTYIEPITLEINASVPGYKESFTNLSLSPASHRYFARLINNDSQLIRVHDLKSPSSFPQNLPVTVEKGQMDGGLDGLRDITPQDFIGFNNGPEHRYGLGALEILSDVDLISIPDLYSAVKIGWGRGFRSPKDAQAIQEAMLNHCEKLRSRIALLDLPPDTGHEQALQWRLQFDSAFGAFYYPWIIVANDGRRTVKVPPSGHVAGVISRSDKEHGVHKPPANEPMLGVVDLDFLLHDSHLASLNRQGINCIKHLPGRGIRIWGARTISSDPQWRFVNVRRIFSAIITALEEGTLWITFEPNNAELWKKIEQVVRGFLNQLWVRGFFQGASADDAFYVRCDQRVNPPESVDAGRLICEIGIAAVRPAEFIIFHVEQDMEDRSTEGNHVI